MQYQLNIQTNTANNRDLVLPTPAPATTATVIMPVTSSKAHAVILLALIVLPHSAHAYVAVFRWATLFINTLRAFFLYWFHGHSDYSMYNFNAVVDDLTVVLGHYMSESHVTENVEKPNILNEGYLCLGEGNVRNLRSLEKVGAIQYKWEADGSVMIHMIYRLRVFVLHYGVFYMRLLGLKKRGSINFDFQENRLVVGVRIAHVSRWWSGRARCIFSITRFEFTELDDIRVTVESNGMTHGELTSQAVTKVFHNNNEFLMKAVKVKLLKDMYTKLQQGNRFICTDRKLDQVAKQMNVMRSHPFTEEYEKRCGRDRPAPTARRGLRFWRRRRKQVEESRNTNSGQSENQD